MHGGGTCLPWAISCITCGAIATAAARQRYFNFSHALQLVTPAATFRQGACWSLVACCRLWQPSFHRNALDNLGMTLGSKALLALRQLSVGPEARLGLRSAPGGSGIWCRRGCGRSAAAPSHAAPSPAWPARSRIRPPACRGDSVIARQARWNERQGDLRRNFPAAPEFQFCSGGATCARAPAAGPDARPWQRHH